MYLVDTDILVYSLKGHPQVVGHLQRTAEVPKAISVISYGELLYGASKSARPDGKPQPDSDARQIAGRIPQGREPASRSRVPKTGARPRTLAHSGTERVGGWDPVERALLVLLSDQASGGVGSSTGSTRRPARSSASPWPCAMPAPYRRDP